MSFRFVSAARYALLGSLGVGWFYCVFRGVCEGLLVGGTRAARAASERSLRLRARGSLRLPPACELRPRRRSAPPSTLSQAFVSRAPR